MSRDDRDNNYSGHKSFIFPVWQTKHRPIVDVHKRIFLLLIFVIGITFFKEEHYKDRLKIVCKIDV